MKVLALTRYADLGASSRVRMLQYIPHLRGLGIDVLPAPLLDNRYVEDLYQDRGPRIRSIAAGYLERLHRLLSAGDFPVVWLEKEMFPWLPARVEEWLRPRRARLVVDYDDAVFARYQGHENAAVRTLLGGKIDRVMRMADVVTAGNAWLREIALQAGARIASLLPSVVDLAHYVPRGKAAGPRSLLGWVGSPSTVHYLQVIRGGLAALGRRRRICLVCVGAPAPSIPGVESVTRPWTQATECAEIARFDVGLMPLADGLWERGKCGYKLIQYMACGVPAVGSAVGANLDIIADGVDGFLAVDEAAWARAVERLLDDDALYTSMSAAARSKVERDYCVQARLSQLATLLAA